MLGGSAEQLSVLEHFNLKGALRNSVLQEVLGCQIAPVPILSPSRAKERCKWPQGLDQALWFGGNRSWRAGIAAGQGDDMRGAEIVGPRSHRMPWTSPM